MFLKPFLKNADSVKAFCAQADKLRELGGYMLLLEMLARKSEERAEQDALHKLDAATTAIQREAWSRGYYEALTDIFDFGRHARPDSPLRIPEANFGAAESLVKDKTITREEYEQLTGKPFTTVFE